MTPTKWEHTQYFIFPPLPTQTVMKYNWRDKFRHVTISNCKQLQFVDVEKKKNDIHQDTVSNCKSNLTWSWYWTNNHQQGKSNDWNLKTSFLSNIMGSYFILRTGRANFLCQWWYKRLGLKTQWRNCGFTKEKPKSWSKWGLVYENELIWQVQCYHTNWYIILLRKSVSIIGMYQVLQYQR